MKIKNSSRKWSHKYDGIRVFPFLPNLLLTPTLTFPLWTSENQIVIVGSRSGRISQSQCMFPHFVIGFVLLLLLLTVWFSLVHKRNVSDGVVSGIRTLFSLAHKLYDFAYNSDSDSVASENQPLVHEHWQELYLFILLLALYVILYNNIYQNNRAASMAAKVNPPFHYWLEIDKRINDVVYPKPLYHSRASGSKVPLQ